MVPAVPPAAIGIRCQITTRMIARPWRNNASFYAFCHLESTVHERQGITRHAQQEYQIFHCYVAASLLVLSGYFERPTFNPEHIIHMTAAGYVNGSSVLQLCHI